MFVAVTAFGETREIECSSYPGGIRVTSVGRVVVGRFPTGMKLHRSQLTLWKRHQERGGKVYSSHGPTAAVIDGEEYVADTTLYTHNRNVGRIVGWYDDEATPEDVVAKWR